MQKRLAKKKKRVEACASSHDDKASEKDGTGDFYYIRHCKNPSKF